VLVRTTDGTFSRCDSDVEMQKTSLRSDDAFLRPEASRVKAVAELGQTPGCVCVCVCLCVCVRARDMKQGGALQSALFPCGPLAINPKPDSDATILTKP